MANKRISEFTAISNVSSGDVILVERNSNYFKYLAANGLLSPTGVSAGTYGTAGGMPQFTVDENGVISNVIRVSTGTVKEVTAGTGLSGGTITGTGTLGLADTSVSAATYGSQYEISVITVDAQGRLTDITRTSVTRRTTVPVYIEAPSVKTYTLIQDLPENLRVKNIVAQTDAGVAVFGLLNASTTVTTSVSVGTTEISTSVSAALSAGSRFRLQVTTNTSSSGLSIALVLEDES